MSEKLNNYKKAKFKCPDCKNKYTSLDRLLNHVGTIHKDVIPEGITVKQYCFNRRNNKTFQICVICKKNKTAWNEKTGRYNRFCCEKCKTVAGRIAEENLKKKTGKTRKERLEDPNVQKEMLNNRSISGTYTFSDKITTIPYVGSYELDFLKIYDLEMNLSPLDIIQCPYTFEYIYENEKHFYIPDYYIISLNLIIEIKDTTSTHPKIINIDRVKDSLKIASVEQSKKFNFIKIYNKDYNKFIDLVFILNDRNSSEDNFSPIIEF